MKIVTILFFICCSAASSVSRNDYSEVKLFEKPVTYDVETTVWLNEISKKEKEVGYKIAANLVVAPVWADRGSEFLLQFQLIKPQLLLRGKHPNANHMPHPSVWDEHGHTTFYAHWKNGLIEAAYLDSDELPDIINYKKSILSVFQFQIFDGEYNETDISGACTILYESLSKDVFRKIKRRCEDNSMLEASAPPGQSDGAARRVARYTLGGGALAGAHVEEVVAVGARSLGLKARSWVRLQEAPPPRPAPPRPATHASLAAALAALPASLAATDLQLILTNMEDDTPPFEELLETYREELSAAGAAGGGGTGALAAAALRLLPAARAAPGARLLAALHHAPNHPALNELCGLLGLAGTGEALAAAEEFLQLSARDPLPQWRAFLAGAALAPPGPAAAELARLAAAARLPAVRRAAATAAAATAPAHAAAALRDQAARALARCKDDDCRIAQIQVLGLLAREDSAELLLEQVERGGTGPALAALEALRLLQARAGEGVVVLHAARRLRLAAVAGGAGGEGRVRAREVRAAAAELALQASTRRAELLPALAAALRTHPHELRRLYWQRLRLLAAEHEPVRHILVTMPPDLTTWNEQALSGTSSVLEREIGWDIEGWRARLQSIQVASGGMLRRGLVRLQARGNSTVDLLAVEVWTRGLQAFATSARPDPDPADPADSDPAEAESVAAGLALAVGGVPLPPITLFENQAELLGHVWAGTGSSPTSVVRAVWPLQEAAGVARLAGGVALRVRWAAGAALALDAWGGASLWARTARAHLALRAAAAAHGRAAAALAWGRLAAHTAAHVEANLSIAADLDFYDAVALCVRVRTEDMAYERGAVLESRLGARALLVRRARRAAGRAAGRTLSLDARNDAACRTLGDGDL